MAQTKAQDLGLFTEAELSGIQPTGSAWAVTPDDPATVPVPLQTVIVKVDGPYTARDRKLWVFLLHAVFDELGETPMHTVPISRINAVFRDLGGDHNTEWIWESAKRLSRTVIEWETTYGDERFDSVAALFGADVPRKGKRGGSLHFFFPPNLIPIIKHPMRFARLRVHFLLSLSGKYAVTLYEILEGYANRRDGQCRVTVEELRTWLKVPEGSYKTWKDFRKWVLDPAVKQINDDPLGAGFSVAYEPIRKGRFYHEILFTLAKTDIRKAQDASLKRSASVARKIASSSRPVLKSGTMDKARRHANGLDLYGLEQEFWAYWERSGKPEFDKGADAAFIGFVKKKGDKL